MALIKPRINRIFAQKTEELIRDMSKRSTCVVVTVTEVFCDNCTYDPVNRSGNGKYNGQGPKPFTGTTCPVCRNKGMKQTEVKQQIEANVKWGKGDNNGADHVMPEGTLPEGMARLKTFARFFKLLEKASYFVVDGIRCSRIGQPKRRGLQTYVSAEQVVQRDD